MLNGSAKEDGFTNKVPTLQSLLHPTAIKYRAPQNIDLNIFFQDLWLKSCLLTGLTEYFPNRFLVTLNWTNRLIHAELKSFLVARRIVLKYSTSYEYLNSGKKNADQNTDELRRTHTFLILHLNMHFSVQMVTQIYTLKSGVTGTCNLYFMWSSQLFLRRLWMLSCMLQ